MPDKVTYEYHGRTSENNNAAMILEKRDGVPVFWWTGYITGYNVKLYPRGSYGKRSPDCVIRKPFTMHLFDLKRAE